MDNRSGLSAISQGSFCKDGEGLAGGQRGWAKGLYLSGAGPWGGDGMGVSGEAAGWRIRTERHLHFIFKKDHLRLCRQHRLETKRNLWLLHYRCRFNQFCVSIRWCNMAKCIQFGQFSSVIFIDSFQLQGSHFFILTKLMETVWHMFSILWKVINCAVALTYQRSVSCRYSADDQCVTSQRVLGQLGVCGMVQVGGLRRETWTNKRATLHNKVVDLLKSWLCYMLFHSASL